MASYSSILAQEMPRSEEPGGVQSMGCQRVGCNWTTKQQQIIHGNVFHYLIRRLLFCTGEDWASSCNSNSKALMPTYLTLLPFLWSSGTNLNVSSGKGIRHWPKSKLTQQVIPCKQLNDHHVKTFGVHRSGKDLYQKCSVVKEPFYLLCAHMGTCTQICFEKMRIRELIYPKTLNLD